VNNHAECKKLKDERAFTLEKLNESKGITSNDCRNLFSYAKVLYELGRYKEAEKYLFSLKEILVAESLNLGDLVLSVFWGLLACEIVN